MSLEDSENWDGDTHILIQNSIAKLYYTVYCAFCTDFGRGGCKNSKYNMNGDYVTIEMI